MIDIKTWLFVSTIFAIHKSKISIIKYLVKFSFMSLEKSQLTTAEQSVICMRTNLSTSTTTI